MGGWRLPLGRRSPALSLIRRCRHVLSIRRLGERGMGGSCSEHGTKARGFLDVC
jgi:hypothetical protein